MKIALLSTSYLESFYKKELKELDLADIIDVYVYYTYEHDAILPAAEPVSFE